MLTSAPFDFRQRLIKKQIPFLVPEHTAYLPFIGVMILNRRAEGKQKTSDKMSAPAHLLILCALFDRSPVLHRMEDVATRCGYTDCKPTTHSARKRKTPGTITFRVS